MTASENMIAVLGRTWAHLAGLSAMELAVNIGLSLVILTAAYVLGRLAKVWLRRAAEVIPGPSDAEKHVRTRRVARFTTFILEPFVRDGVVSVVDGGIAV